jgi:hypothetical protein
MPEKRSAIHVIFDQYQQQLYERFRRHCLIDERRPMSEVARDAIREYLGRAEGKPGRK